MSRPPGEATTARPALPPQAQAPSTQRPGLTAQQHPELLVEEFRLLARHQGARGALPHGIHEAHARQRHLLAAALVAEALSAAAAVVLGAGQGEQ